jgi:hypothetical protein
MIDHAARAMGLPVVIRDIITPTRFATEIDMYAKAYRESRHNTEYEVRNPIRDALFPTPVSVFLPTCYAEVGAIGLISTFVTAIEPTSLSTVLDAGLSHAAHKAAQ